MNTLPTGLSTITKIKRIFLVLLIIFTATVVYVSTKQLANWTYTIFNNTKVTETDALTKSNLYKDDVIENLKRENAKLASQVVESQEICAKEREIVEKQKEDVKLIDKKADVIEAKRVKTIKQVTVSKTADVTSVDKRISEVQITSLWETYNSF
jgi:hypothetical protein